MEHRQAPATDPDGLVAGPHSRTSNGPSNRQAFPGDGTLADGSILLYIEEADEGQGDELRHEFNLVLTDDPAFPRSHGITNDVVDVLEQWRQHIVDLVVFPRVFTIMSQAAVHA